MIIARTTQSTFQLRLPARVDSTSVIHLVAHIQDSFGSVTESPLPSVSVRPNFTAIEDLINKLEQSNSPSSSSPLIELLITGDQNTVGQIITSISQILNEMNKEIIQAASLSKYLLLKVVKKLICYYRWYSSNRYFNYTFE